MDDTKTLRITTPSETEIVMTRTFDAPRRLVFDAFTSPELLRQWIGRSDDEMTVCEVDLRVGGAYRYEWLLQEGDIFREVGTFRELDPPARIVSSEAFDKYSGETLISTTFEEEDGRTTVNARCRYPSKEIRDEVLAGGVEKGAGESYDRLAELLQSLQ